MLERREDSAVGPAAQPGYEARRSELDVLRSSANPTLQLDNGAESAICLPCLLWRLAPRSPYVTSCGRRLVVVAG